MVFFWQKKNTKGVNMFLLEELRKESGLKRSDLAKQLNINQNTLANYEKELRQAPYETLILIADYFSVSVDELLGRTTSSLKEEVKKPATDLKPEFSPLAKKEKDIIYAYRRLSPENKERLLDYLGLLGRLN